VPLRSGFWPIEFMFYNAELSGSSLGIIDNVGGQLVAKKSRLPLPQVRRQVEAAVAGLNLAYPFSALPGDWRAQLKACYEKHFGATGNARNNISLCLYVKPLLAHDDIGACCAFDVHGIGAGAGLDHRLEALIDLKRPALLCTGDLKLDGSVIAAMQSHFGPARWDAIGTTQVPHHGSQHSWEPGNASLLHPSVFVHCAAGTAAHPHATVTKDLAGETVVTADYKHSATLAYHFSS
jgi:hypothetical protein